MTKSNKNLPLLAFDTSTACYILLGAKNDKIQERIDLMDMLFDEKRFQYVLPAQVISEILVAIPKTKRAAVLREISSNFEILSFNEESAVIAASIYSTTTQVREKKKETKARVKYDAQIIGTCLSWGITRLCSFDGDQCKRFVSLAESLPEIADKIVAGPPDAFIKAGLLAHAVKTRGAKQNDQTKDMQEIQKQ